jgi:hypothetical protein
MAKSFAEHKDSLHHHKHSLFEYDLVISNNLNFVQIIPLNPELIKETTMADKFTTLLKRTRSNEVFFDMVKTGILFAEGN